MVDRQALVDLVVTEALAVLRVQVRDDHRDQPFQVGMRQAAEEAATLIGIQLLPGGPLERPVREIIRRARVAQGLGRQGRGADDPGIQLDRQGTLRPLDPPLVIVVQVQLLADVGQRFLWLVGVVHQRLAVDQFPCGPGGVPAVSLDPQVEELLIIRPIPRVLVVETVVEIIVVRPRNQLLQGLGPVFRQAEGLDVTDLVCRKRSQAKRAQTYTNNPFHKKPHQFKYA